ncbi:MAG: hypothetical protein AUJ28_03570 [Parcubacteria group bacterium CG1_02_37_51]|uniref:Uncharacterized protein n=2 Tax=Candidatus Komeiliibacteriota TaxID=1817908 RepID=A0A2M8DSF1_9BACT|nr:MAG: hypothetical protein AUJ28_03570 [Parcubacteria group bacterium CG1_02_37_51]PIY94762.1 MAG: hypothetical protein COY67_02155 [Candidatus Komeilibacteria bacterium CG_4_10_14_0_8_um_filter_37_78]PJC02298.1 MAG: hypothetical protein CO073_00210 [Candidatus Komeilibacteria bacterium CG_4_9_14_0_8_um_filter_36_9]
MNYKKIAWIGGAIILIIVIIVVATRKEQTNYVTAEVGYQTLIKTVSATGSVRSADEIDLTFEATGRINKINIAVGDEVRAGQTLAQLNTATVSADVANAQANLAAANAELERIMAGSSAEDRAISEQQVTQAELNLEQAYNDLQSTEGERDDKIETYRQIALNNLATKNFYSRTSLDIIDTILSDSDAINLLGILNTSYKNATINDYDLLENQYTDIELLLNLTTSSSTSESIIETLAQLINYQTNIADLLVNAYLMLENSVTSATFTTTELEAYKTNVKTQQTNLDTALSNLQTAKTNLSYNIIFYNNSVASAEDSIQTSQEALALAQAQLMLKTAEPRSFEISLYQARIQQAQAAVQTTYANLNKYLIKAPLDGTITSISKEVGEQTMSSEAVIKMIGKSELEIEVDIPEADIALVNVGDPVDITLDAYGSAVVFNGQVVFIDPAETIIQDVVYYKVKVQFTLVDQAVKTGMTANVDILIEEKEGVLAVPSRSVYRVDGQDYVKVLQDNELVERVVTTGLRDDLGYIEILSGLDSGLNIVLSENNGQ